MNSAIVNTLIGRLRISIIDKKVVEVTMLPKGRKLSQSSKITDKLLLKTIRQIEEYLTGSRTEFDLPIQSEGSPFETKVWQQLRKIPYGNTMTYKGVAESIECPKAFRAVGSACGKNKLLLIVPCHRVVQTGGGLGGFACGLSTKKKLLSLETSELSIN